MGLKSFDFEVSSWTWRKHVSKASGKEMLSVTYYGGLSDPTITEYHPILHDGYIGQKAMEKLTMIAEQGKIIQGGMNVQTLNELIGNLNKTRPPETIKLKRDGKFFRVINRSWV